MGRAPQIPYLVILQVLIGAPSVLPLQPYRVRVGRAYRAVESYFHNFTLVYLTTNLPL